MWGGGTIRGFCCHMALGGTGITWPGPGMGMGGGWNDAGAPTPCAGNICGIGGPILNPAGGGGIICCRSNCFAWKSYTFCSSGSCFDSVENQMRSKLSCASIAVEHQSLACLRPFTSISCLSRSGP